MSVSPNPLSGRAADILFDQIHVETSLLSLLPSGPFYGIDREILHQDFPWGLRAHGNKGLILTANKSNGVVDWGRVSTFNNSMEFKFQKRWTDIGVVSIYFWE
jgi:hypothetical protein